MHQINKVKFHFAVFSLVGLASAAIAAPPTLHPPKAVAKAESAARPVAANTPDAALRRFLIAMVMQDRKTMRATIVPVSDADFGYLASGEAPPGGTRVRAQFERMPIKTLKPGDTVALPGGRTTTLPAKGLGPDEALLLPEGFPLPFLMQRIKGTWKVNAAPLIGARKSAAKMNADPLVGPPQK